MKKPDIRFAFFGTSPFSILILDELQKAGFTPTLVVTPPDKPQGRKHIVTPPPAKVWALEHNIDILQPEKITGEVVGELGNSEWDVFIVASYGKILPKALIDIPHKGVLNVHPSLLPKYRGASPLQAQILADDRFTGVTIMQIDEEMDHGPIVSQARVEIAEDDWPVRGSELREMLGTLGGSLLVESLLPWIEGEITAEEQDHGTATYVKKVAKEDAELDLENGNSRENFLKIKAFDVWPVAYFFTEKNGKTIRVKVTDAEYKNNTLVIKTVIPEGRKEMSYEDFLRG